jgi:lysozyme
MKHLNQIGEKGLNLIKEFEGLRLVAYKCPAGVWTIGYGHTYNVKEGDVITEAKATEFLLDDISNAVDIVSGSTMDVELTQNQFDALVSFTYNVGVKNFSDSTLLRKVKLNPNDPTIANEFKKWIYAGKEVLSGLVKRRKAESELYFKK